MKRVTDRFNECWITILVDETLCLFRADDIAQAVGYYDTSSLMRNIPEGAKYINQYKERFLSLRQISKASKKASRTPILKEFFNWARRWSDMKLSELKNLKKAAEVKQPAPHADDWVKPFQSSEYTVKEAADKVGMKHAEFITWMTNQGYFETFKSNGHLKMSRWFKDQQLGFNPLAESGRVSNTIRISQKGLEFIKNRLASSRESAVLSFANSNAIESKELEKGVTELINEKFKQYTYQSDYSGLAKHQEYRLDNEELQRAVRQVVAEIKLKEINGTQQGQ